MANSNSVLNIYEALPVSQLSLQRTQTRKQGMAELIPSSIVFLLEGGVTKANRWLEISSIKLKLSSSFLFPTCLLPHLQEVINGDLQLVDMLQLQHT